MYVTRWLWTFWNKTLDIGYCIDGPEETIRSGEIPKNARTSAGTTAYHPQSYGSLERSRVVLGKYLKQFVQNCEMDDWL